MIDLYTWDTPNGRKISIMLEEVSLPYKVYPVARHERHQTRLEDFPKVKRWFDSISARPQVQRGMAVPNVE